MNILVLMTCHNRVRQTRMTIEAAENSATVADVNLVWSIVDDGSGDGTSDAISNSGSEVLLTQGSGKLFWNGGMKLAWSSGKDVWDDYEYVLWLNDDVTLDVECLDILMAELTKSQAEIIVGSCRSTLDQKDITYGGFRNQHFLPSKLKRVFPNGEIQKIDTFNGNVVMVKMLTMKNLGFRSFKHSYGDIDFGIRATLLGITSVLASKSIAVCDRNTDMVPWLNPTHKLRTRIAYFVSPKGFPLDDHIMFYQPTFGRVPGIGVGLLSWLYNLVKTILIAKKDKQPDTA